jgi:lipid A 3-O-deacylase
MGSQMLRTLLLIASLVIVPRVAHAVDGMSLELGSSDSGNASVDMARVGLQWDWDMRMGLSSNWYVGGYWDLSLAHWSNDSPARTNSSLTDIGFTPVFRLQQTNPGPVAPYMEAAVGAHFLTETSVSAERRFGSSFQFGSHVGVGLRFGARRAFDLSYRYQHLSNAGIKEPNQGINFHLVRIQYHF